MMPLELRNRRSGHNRSCRPVAPPEEERRAVRPRVAELEEETALLPDHGGRAVRVVRLEVDPSGDRDAARNVEVRRVRYLDVVVDAVELPRSTEEPRDVRGLANRSVIPTAREVLHLAVGGESLHVVRQNRTGGVRWSDGDEAHDLIAVQGAGEKLDLIKNAFEPFGGPVAHPQRV